MASISELQEASLGLTDKAIGLVREAVGTILGNDGLADAGKAQQDKGTDRLEAIKHEAKADAARTKAMAQDKAERAAQGKSNDGAGQNEFSKSGIREAGGGLAERLKGQAKEAVGSITNNSDLKREGNAQQAKGEAKSEAAKEEAKADAARAKARTADARQRAAEQSA